MKVFVLYGQGGVITSYGMKRLADRIAATWPHLQVSTHNWYEWLKLPGAEAPCMLIGYSLGANAVTWNAAKGGNIALAVCYDPSILSVVVQPGPNIKKLILYHNSDWEPEGHAVFRGPQVTKYEISMPHLAICYSEKLHQITLEAIKKVL